MSITKTAQGWRAVARVRIRGRIIERAALCSSREDAKRTIEQLKEDIRATTPDTGSLKCDTFTELVEHYLSRHGDAGMKSKFDCLKREIGDARLHTIGDRFDVFLYGYNGRGGFARERSARTGRLRSPATVNRHIAVAKMICSFGVEHGLLPTNPIKGRRFRLRSEEGRDRVLSLDEEKAFFKVLKDADSYLLPVVRFAMRNPIRAGDLFNLTRENWDEFDGWVHFYASKTRARRNRETCLVCVDDDTRAWFRSLPQDCPYLFPVIDAAGNWSKMRDYGYREQWEAMCDQAEISDFRFHDLKHCAVTWMRDNGFTELDFENLGIQYSLAMIRRYYKTDAHKAASKWQDIKIHVA